MSARLIVLSTIFAKLPGGQVLPPNAFPAKLEEDRPTRDERLPMPATTSHPSAPDTTLVEDPFVLNVRIITDVPPNHPLAACKGGTDDGCDPTCASACISDGV